MRGNGKMRLALLALAALGGEATVGAPTPAAGEAAIEVNKGHVDFKVGKALVARYVTDPSVPRPYFWPLNAPSGVPLTRAWPMGKAEPSDGKKPDHVHHRSAWFCHGDVIPEGMKLKHKIKGVVGVDFWSEHEGHGKIVCTKVGEPKAEKNHAWVTTHNEWRTADGVKVMDEERTIHLHNFGAAWLLVLDIDLHASVTAITFGDTKEGSMGVRVRSDMRADRKGTLTNAEGKSRQAACWGRISAWCDYSGPTDGKVAGVSIFADPTNAVASAWHARDYGLLAANPFGRAKAGFPDTKEKKDLVKLAKDKHLKLRYGLLLHDGDVKEGKVADYYAKFTKLKGKE